MGTGIQQLAKHYDWASTEARAAEPETPEDVAGVVSFLASRDSDYMTGQAVNIDGGLDSDAGRASEWAEFIDVVTQYLEDSGLDYRQPLGLT